MFGGQHEFNEVMDADGHYLRQNPELRPDLENKMWTYDLDTEEWEEPAASNLQNDTISRAALTFDEENEVGWFYGGSVQQEKYIDMGETVESTGELRMMRNLYRLEANKLVEKVDTKNTRGYLDQGEMVYIADAGDNGVLVAIGGNSNGSNPPTMVSTIVLDENI